MARCCSCRRILVLSISILLTLFIILSNDDDEWIPFERSEESLDEAEAPSNDYYENEKDHSNARSKIEDDYNSNNPRGQNNNNILEELENFDEDGDGRENDSGHDSEYQVEYMTNSISNDDGELVTTIPDNNDYADNNFQGLDYDLQNSKKITLTDIKGGYTSLFKIIKASNAGGIAIQAQAPIKTGSVDDEINRLVNYIQNSKSNKIKCNNVKYVGSAGNSTGPFRDGAYHICYEEPFWPNQNKRKFPCLGYSFGIDYEWSFDDGLSRDFGCEVHSFDPGMYDEPLHFTRHQSIYFHRMGIDSENSDSKYHRAMRDYSYRKKYGDEKLEELRNWHVRTLKQFMLELDHKNRFIDIVKIDIEGPRQGYEIEVIRNMLQTGAFRCVRQLSFELHLFGPIYDPIYVRSTYGVLKALEDNGFKMFGLNPSFNVDIEDRMGRIAHEKTELLWCLGFVNMRPEKCQF